ncbi:hypothetical protein PNEG_02106 [Pneumocystis murina B123]|uniref:NADH dehydrogenase [ubiquinone] 1 beta subcomplex subunit 11, mitochondrial n=1 Tax=Pneumocystis murina (strain B123) TaxID=1069680 RepID=M7P6L0_PNEMU|nr:hypothetical protein PNEG_02106 [Pneumocystis murina B123]EMR09520.1 hypothetical protein PNEG_02106 [Pneumocystis murina B123]
MFLHKICQFSIKNTKYKYIRRHLDKTSIYYFLKDDFPGFSRVRYASGTPKYYEPTSVLFGEETENQDWRTIWKYGMGGFMLIATILYIYKPKTGIRIWALEEAKKRIYSEKKE